MTVEIAVKVIGSGGAFDTDKINSSFLIIENNKPTMLVDCGYNVFEYLKENNIDVQDIFITHTHFDHIGSLESLIFYNYFVRGKTTRIFSGIKVIEHLKEIFKNINNVYENGQLIPVNIVEFIDLPDANYSYEIGVIEMNHIVTPTYGLVIKSPEKIIIISGDTKASKNLVEYIEKEIQNKEIVVFHDFSEWNDTLRNIHCCKTDFDAYYAPLLEKYDNLKFIFYHNGSNVDHIEKIIIGDKQ